MPLVYYKGAHGRIDVPHHFALFGELERRGVLDRVDIALDGFLDPVYVAKLVQRFPQLVLATDLSRSRRAIETLQKTVQRGYGALAKLHQADAIIESPGGRLHPSYSGDVSNWWLYPNARRRAFFFHSLEDGVQALPKLAQSVAECDIFIARTIGAAERASELGCPNVVTSCDVVFLHTPERVYDVPGVAAALRVPQGGGSQPYIDTLKAILDRFEADVDRMFDLVKIEPPMDAEYHRRGYIAGERPNIRLHADDSFYHPFRARRDAVISCRFHTAIMALLYGNRKLLQIQVESGTNKVRQLVDDLGLVDLPVYGPEDLTLDLVDRFLDEGHVLPDDQVERAITTARDRVAVGMDAAEEWLLSL